MRNGIVPNAASFPWRICYVEDSPVVSEPIKRGMEVLLDAQVDLFTTIAKASTALETEGYGKYQVYVLDNRAGSGKRGITLAQEIKQKSSEAIVVSLSSSDMDEIREFGFEKLHSLGIEFWYKHSEGFLMIPWLAECAKSNRMIPRDEWLASVGEETRYFAGDERRETERELNLLCQGFQFGIDENTRGILMKRDVRSYLQELTAAGSGREKKSY